MTDILFARPTPVMNRDRLCQAVRDRLPHKDNEKYFSEILNRKNADSIKESLSALLLLCRLLERRGIDTSILVIKRAENKKPYFENSSLHFSLSHSKGYAAAALSDLCRVGLDIECTEISGDRAKKLADRFFGDDEKDKAAAYSEDFLRAWTKKEAYAKMQGMALSELMSLSKKYDGIEANAQKEVFFAEFSVDSYPLTVCLEKKDGEIEFDEFKPSGSL